MWHIAACRRTRKLSFSEEAIDRFSGKIAVISSLGFAINGS
jgi:hypothetical protein